MEEILGGLEAKDKWKQLMRGACRTNGIPTTFAGELTILKLRYLNQRFQKSYDSQGEKVRGCWMENELKAYCWVLLALSLLLNLPIADFGEFQWNQLGIIFRDKSRMFLKFQARRFLSDRSHKSRAWGRQEQQMLTHLVRENSEDLVKWNQVARNLFESSNQLYFRTGKQCRERWLNHLDPIKKRGDWETSQDLFILQSVQQQGKKWSKIARNLKNQRTEHTIKNRFHSLLIKQAKITPEAKKESRLINLAIENLYGIEENEIVNSDEKSMKQQIQKQEVSIVNKQLLLDEPVGSGQDLEREERLSNIRRRSSNEYEEIQSHPAMGIDPNFQYLLREDPQVNRQEVQPLFSPLSFYMVSPGTITPNCLSSSSPNIPFWNGSGFAFCTNIFYNHVNNLMNGNTEQPNKED